MTGALLVLTFLAAVNPARFWISLPQERRRWEIPALAGAAGVFAVSAGVVMVSDSLLSGLDVSPETFRIAAGLVMVVAGLWSVVVPARREEPVLAGTRAALVPVAFPLLLTPELVMLLVAAGADEPSGTVLAAAGASLAVAAAGTLISRSRIAGTIMTGVARLFAALLATSGIWLIIDGIRDV